MCKFLTRGLRWTYSVGISGGHWPILLKILPISDYVVVFVVLFGRITYTISSLGKVLSLIKVRVLSILLQSGPYTLCFKKDMTNVAK